MQDTSKFFIEFIRLAGPFWSASNKSPNRGLLVTLVTLTLFQIGISVTITEWSADLFDALEQRSMSRLFTQVGMIIVVFVADRKSVV